MPYTTEDDLTELLHHLHDWMGAYMKSFHTEDEEVMRGIRIKEEHTGYVTRIARELARHLQLRPHDVQLAEIMGLFHDVGRFRQYSLYQTFNDARSEDHADLGLKVLAELDVLHELAPEDLELVRFAIQEHNKKAIRPTDDKRKLLFAKLLRDADKQDIYRVLAPFLDPKHAAEAPKFVKGVDKLNVSQDFVEHFAKGEQADYYEMRTHGDRIVVRLMWVYDINFGWTLERLMEQGYIEKIIACLPEQEGLAEGVERLRKYISERIEIPDKADIY